MVSKRKTANSDVPQGTLLNQLVVSLKQQADLLNLNTSQVAAAANVSRVTVSNLFGGKLDNASIDTLERIATALGCGLSINLVKQE